MIREAIGIGETEELAKQDALNQLGLNSDSNVKFEVMKKAEKKKFGIFGGSPAKVKAIYEMSDDLLSDNVQQELNSSASENVIENNNIDKEEISVAYNEEGQAAEEADVVNIPNDYAPAVEAKSILKMYCQLWAWKVLQWRLKRKKHLLKLHCRVTKLVLLLVEEVKLLTHCNILQVW